MRPWAADSIVVRPVGFAGYGQATSTGVRDITADSDATTYGAGVRYKMTQTWFGRRIGCSTGARGHRSVSSVRPCLGYEHGLMSSGTSWDWPTGIDVAVDWPAWHWKPH